MLGGAPLGWLYLGQTFVGARSPVPVLPFRFNPIPFTKRAGG